MNKTRVEIADCSILPRLVRSQERASRETKEAGLGIVKGSRDLLHHASEIRATASSAGSRSLAALATNFFIEVPLERLFRIHAQNATHKLYSSFIRFMQIRTDPPVDLRLPQH